MTIPLSAILFAAPYSMTRFALPEAGFGLITVFLFLLLVRMQDDLSDMAIDRITHPERGLVSGTVNPRTLQICIASGTGIVLVLHFFAHLFWPTFGLLLVYAIFYSFKRLIPLPLHPVFVNIVFFFVPVYTGLLAHGDPARIHFLLGLFIWTSVIAHDFAHSVHGRNESPPDVATFSNVLGPLGSAVIALLAFVCAGLVGVFFWAESGQPFFYFIFLILLFVYILFLSIRLVKLPTIARAKPFYVAGFVFFLLPLLGLIIDKYLGLRL